MSVRAVFNQKPFFRAASALAVAAAVSAPQGPAFAFLGGIAMRLGHKAAAVSGLILSLFAGHLGGHGYIDGLGPAARFGYLQSVVVDSSGNLFVADFANDVIRKVDPSGATTTFAGSGASGFHDGMGTAAKFSFPAGIAIDSSNNIYVSDSGNSAVRKITPAGAVTTITSGGWLDASISGIVVDSSGFIYVSDGNNYDIVKISGDGSSISVFAGSGSSGSANGLGTAASFGGPAGLAIDASQKIYVADSGNNTIRAITPGGLVSTLAGITGTCSGLNGSAISATFCGPQGVWASGGSVYVGDSVNDLIRKIAPGGSTTTVAGAYQTNGHVDGTGTAATFYHPQGLTVDSSGNIFVADTYNGTIRKITSAGAVTTFAGQANGPGGADGTGAAAAFSSPAGMSADSSGNVYVADQANSTIRKITPGGATTTLAGTAGVQGHADGSGASASFYLPAATAVDSHGNVFVADTLNSTIRKITPAGLVTTFAGSYGNQGGQDGPGATATFDTPFDIAIDAADNLYVADTDNCTIRMITSAAIVSTVAGSLNNCGSQDGPAHSAQFFLPQGIASDAAGTLYIADTLNSTIRKLSGGVVTTISGVSGSPGNSDGPFGTALFSFPQGVAIAPTGSVYVADTSNQEVRKIDTAGLVTTVLGSYKTNGAKLGSLPGSLTNVLAVMIYGGQLYVPTENSILVVNGLP